MWAGNKAVLRKWQSALGNDTFGIVQIAVEGGQPMQDSERSCSFGLTGID